MNLWQGYHSNTVGLPQSLDEAKRMVQERHPGWNVTVSKDGEIITAVKPGVGGTVYGLISEVFNDPSKARSQSLPPSAR